MKKTLLIAPLTLGALVFGLSASGCSSAANNLLTNKHLSNLSSELKEEYDYCDVLLVPQYSFNFDGTSVSSTGTVVFPDGSSYNSSKVELNQYGYYTIKYTAGHNGKYASHEEHFIVRKNLFRVDDLDNSFVIKNEVPSYAAAYTSADGVYVGLAKGDTLTVEQEINVKELTSLDDVVKGFITPKEQGVFDFSQITFYLTDITDPDLYIKWQLSGYANYDSVWAGISYYQAGASGQVSCGYDYDSHKVNSNGIFGTKVTFPFNAKVHNGAAYKSKLVDPSSYQFNIAFDYENKISYGHNLKIADLDSASYFTKFFEGFKSDKVKLSIKCSSYTDSIARFCLTSVLGVDLSQNKVIDDVAPEITVDNDYDVMPEGSVNVAYPIPSASAYDMGTGETSVITEVYYNYNNNSPIRIPTDGLRFTPTRNGYYTIVYTSKDIYNNIATKELWVHVGDDISSISARIDPSLVSACKVGEIIDVPDLLNLSGGSGNLKVNVSASKNGEEVEIKNNKFQPLSIGNWTIKYTITDYIGNTKIVGKSLSVADSQIPVLAEVAKVSPSYMSGASYELPVVYGYNFDGGVANKVLCDVEVIDANGTNTYNSDKFTPSVTENNTPITINFKHRGLVLHTENPKVIMPYVDGRLKMVNYFIGEGFNVDTSNDGIVIEQTSSTSRWEFFSPLIANNFSLTVGNTENTDYDDIKVTIQDKHDTSKAVSIEIDNSGSKPLLKLNKKTYDFVFDFTSEELLEFGFNGKGLVVNNVEYNLNFFDDGSEFTGFPSEFVYASVVTKGHAGTSYFVSQINKNVLGGSGADKTEPEFYITDAYGGKFPTGTTYKLPRVIYNDVLSPVVTAKLTVKDPNGTIVNDIDGNPIKDISPDNDMYIVLEQYGSYVISYSFDDKSDLSTRNNVKSFSYKVNSADNEAPIITVTSSWTKEAKVGDTIVMPNFDVSDNVTAKEDIKVIKSVVNPMGYETLLPENSNSIVVKHSGTYTFKITAIDGDGNSAFLTFECVVK